MKKIKGIILFLFINLFLFLLLSPAWASGYDQAEVLKTFDYTSSLSRDEWGEREVRTKDFWYEKMPEWLPESFKKSAAQVIYICDQSANTTLELVSLAGEFLIKPPILVYGAGSETMLTNFINSLLFENPKVEIMETESNTISDEFMREIEEKTGVETERNEPIDEFVYNFCLEKKNYPKVLVVADQEIFGSFACLYAGRSDGVFVNSVEEAEKIWGNDKDVNQIVYFGNNPETAEELKTMSQEQQEASFPSFFKGWSYSSKSGSSNWFKLSTQETFTQVSSISEAESTLTQKSWAGGLNPQKAVTVISSDNSEYWWIAPIYAYYRDTALVSVETKDKSVEEIDTEINSKLDQNVLPYNYGKNPDYLIISEPWEIVPYRLYKEDYMGGLYVAADTIYADRDGDFVQDMAVGRFTAYDTPTAATLMNRGYFFDKGEMKRGDKALIIHPWKEDFVIWIPREWFESNFYARLGVEPAQNYLNDMYGEGNVYGQVGYETTGEVLEPDESWPALGSVIRTLWDSEFNYLGGHSNPYCVVGTNPIFCGPTLQKYGPYSPSLWYLSSCSTGVYHPDYLASHPEAEGKVTAEDTLIHTALTSGAVNMVVSADNVPYGNYADWIEWPAKYLAQGESVGQAIMKGQSIAAKNVNKLSLYRWMNEEMGYNPICKQTYLIGDPMVKNYGSKLLPRFSIFEKVDGSSVLSSETIPSDSGEEPLSYNDYNGKKVLKSFGTEQIASGEPEPQTGLFGYSIQKKGSTFLSDSAEAVSDDSREKLTLSYDEKKVLKSFGTEQIASGEPEGKPQTGLFSYSNQNNGNNSPSLTKFKSYSDFNTPTASNTGVDKVNSEASSQSKWTGYPKDNSKDNSASDSFWSTTTDYSAYKSTPTTTDYSAYKSTPTQNSPTKSFVSYTTDSPRITLYKDTPTSQNQVGLYSQNSSNSNNKLGIFYSTQARQ